jgi:hypothetical protein
MYKSLALGLALLATAGFQTGCSKGATNPAVSVTSTDVAGAWTITKTKVAFPSLGHLGDTTIMRNQSTATPSNITFNTDNSYSSHLAFGSEEDGYMMNHMASPADTGTWSLAGSKIMLVHKNTAKGTDTLTFGKIDASNATFTDDKATYSTGLGGGVQLIHTALK